MNKIKKWILWSFVILWMGNIISFSSKPAEISKKQSGFFVAFAQKMVAGLEKKLNISLLNTDKLDHYIRKTAHVFNYFVLTLLLIFAYFSIKKSKKYVFVHSSLFAFLFSIFDELFQTFVPGRSGVFRDVLIDQIGTIMALLLIYLVLKRKLTTRKTRDERVG
jgi:VanZ family protein